MRSLSASPSAPSRGKFFLGNQLYGMDWHLLEPFLASQILGLGFAPVKVEISSYTCKNMYFFCRC